MPSVSFLFGDCIERSLSIVDIAVSMTKQSIHFSFPTFALRSVNWQLPRDFLFTLEAGP